MNYFYDANLNNLNECHVKTNRARKSVSLSFSSVIMPPLIVEEHHCRPDV